MGSGRFRRVLACTWLCTFMLASLGCGRKVVAGTISPTLFQFHPVVPHTGPGPGGWKVALVLVSLGKLSLSFPAAATCDIEVGVPEANHLGRVSDSFAQTSSASAADAAARKVLQEGPPTAAACQRFRDEMGATLGDRKYGLIPGAKVTAFSTPNITPERFP